MILPVCRVYEGGCMSAEGGCMSAIGCCRAKSMSKSHKIPQYGNFVLKLKIAVSYMTYFLFFEFKLIQIMMH